jgi:hypothetical protein
LGDAAFTQGDVDDRAPRNNGCLIKGIDVFGNKYFLPSQLSALDQRFRNASFDTPTRNASNAAIL